MLQYASLAFFTPLTFAGRSIVHATVHDTKRSSNWPIAVVTRNRGLGYSHIAILLPIAFCIAIIVCVAYCGWATWENCKPSNHRPTEYGEAPEGYGQEPVFDTPATGQLDQPVSAGYGHGGNWASATPVASAPPVEQSTGWTPAQHVYK